LHAAKHRGRAASVSSGAIRALGGSCTNDTPAGWHFPLLLCPVRRPADDGNIGMDRIPDLMRMMPTEMAREFPGQDLTVLAYAPSNPPRKIGTARLDGRTREMSYVTEK